MGVFSGTLVLNFLNELVWIGLSNQPVYMQRFLLFSAVDCFRTFLLFLLFILFFCYCSDIKESETTFFCSSKLSIFSNIAFFVMLVCSNAFSLLWWSVYSSRANGYFGYNAHIILVVSLTVRKKFLWLYQIRKLTNVNSVNCA